MRDAYREAQLDPPDRIVWLASPLQGVIAAAEFWRQDGDQVLEQILDGDRVRTEEPLWHQVFAHVFLPICHKIDQVGDLVWDQLCAQIKDHALGPLSSAIPGPGAAARLSNHDAVDTIFGRSEFMPSVRGLIRVAKSAGWWWPFKKIAILTDRPCVLWRDAQNRLHSDDGPALSYRDGFSVYASHGTRVPDWIIERPQDITPDLIDAERNIEVRRVMVERFKRGEAVSGAAAYHHDAVSELLDDDPRWGRLYRRRRPDDDDLVLVQVPNATPEPDGSIKDYWLRVHPECRPMIVNIYGSESLGDPQELTALNAIASTFGMTGEEYVRVSMES